MTAELAGQIWMMIGAYAGVGVIIALLFVTVLIKRASAGARTSAPVQFRILIFPACAALWPIILIRGLMGGAKGEADETSA
jgi:hypothetical protein